MSNWKRWPDLLNARFAEIEHPAHIIYPDLNDGSPLVLACDHSGEHALPEFRVLSFLLTTYKSVAEWDSSRLAVRQRYLTNERRMSFKALNDALRINAFSSFLDAASQLNGVLVCVGVEKGFSFPKDDLPDRQHDWTPDTLNKLIEICVFGSVMVDGLRSEGQLVHWITDDDSTVSTEYAKNDAAHMFGSLLHNYPDERVEIGLSIASQFDDGLRAEDLVAIPDFAAGAFSETLTMLGKANMPMPGVRPNKTETQVQIKTSLINSWRYDNSKPLKHINAVIRQVEGGGMLVSFGSPYVRVLLPSESAADAPSLNSKWRKAIEAHLKDRNINPTEMLRSMGIDSESIRRHSSE